MISIAIFPVLLARVSCDFRPKSLVIADMGCGDAQLARTLPNHVHSFDLVAVNDSVFVSDIANVSQCLAHYILTQDNIILLYTFSW